MSLKNTKLHSSFSNLKHLQSKGTVRTGMFLKQSPTENSQSLVKVLMGFKKQDLKKKKTVFVFAWDSYLFIYFCVEN